MNLLSPSLTALLNRYALADVMAQLFKTLRVRTIKGLFILAIIGFLSFQIYLELFAFHLLLLSYPLILCVAVVWYWYAKAKEFERKHEDYRALAEAIRVQFFWQLTGIDGNAADHYLHKHKSELEWIRYAVRVWSITAERGQDIPHEIYELVRNLWVDDQTRWFKKRTRENNRTVKHSHIASKILFSLSLSLALVLFLLQLTSFADRLGPETMVHSLVVVVIAMSLAIAAAIQGYLEKLAISEQSKQYKRMADLYNSANEKFRHAIAKADLEECRRLCVELGNEALIENGDWILLHRERLLEVPLI